MRIPMVALALALSILPIVGEEAPSLIVDTDMLTDCDDAGALALLHALADRGEARLLGIVCDGQDTLGKHGAVVSAIDTFYGRGTLPIGVDRRPGGMTPRKHSSYSQAVFAEFPNDGLLDEQRPDALTVYRRLLADAPDRSVTIVGIGFLTNLDSLLRSPGDAIDARDGVALVRAKVRSLVLMGGRHPSGSDHNFTYPGARAAASYVIGHWPDEQAPMVFSGYEIGAHIVTGTAYAQAPPSPMRRCYELAYDSLAKGRPSWDQTAALLAVRGLAHQGVGYWTAAAPGSIAIDDQVGDAWLAAPVRRQSYLVKALDEAALAMVIEELMITPPHAARR